MALPTNANPRIFHVLICVFKETQGKTKNKGGRIIVSASLVRNNRFISFLQMNELYYTRGSWYVVHFKHMDSFLSNSLLQLLYNACPREKELQTKMVILPSTKVQNSNLDETQPNYLIVWSARLKAFFKSL